MADPKSYALTDLTRGSDNEPTLTLWIEGIGNFNVVQLSMTYALNEIPRAACLVAIGRDAKSEGAAKKAKIHEAGNKLTQLRKAEIWFEPKWYWNTDNKTMWEGRKCIFQGYYTGLAYKKITDKVQPVLHLIHWLCDLGFSSTLSANHHPSNPSSMVFPAVVPGMTGASEPAIYVGHHYGYDQIASRVPTDVWEGIKYMLCEMAEIEKPNMQCRSFGCGGGLGDPKKNERATKALEKIEGESAKCKKKYEYGKPLALETYGIPLIPRAVEEGIVHQTMESFSHMTYWDAIVGLYCPMFSAAVVPMVDRALIVADCPAYSAAQWKTIDPSEYDSLELSGMITRPLQGVGVYADWEMLTNWKMTEVTKGDHICVGGHFAEKAPEPSPDDGDGMWMVVRSPQWLRNVTHVGNYAGHSQGVVPQVATNASTTPKPGETPPDPRPGTILLSPLCQLYEKYAQAVFVENMLRGRSAQINGKLRFDIAPGSHIKVLNKGESFLEGEDDLAVTLFGHVVRVTWNINSEAKLAGTTLELNHVRTETENGHPRTSMSSHPLFKDPIYFGSGINATKSPGTLDRDWEFPGT